MDESSLSLKHYLIVVSGRRVENVKEAKKSKQRIPIAFLLQPLVPKKSQL